MYLISSIQKRRPGDPWVLHVGMVGWQSTLEKLWGQQGHGSRPQDKVRHSFLPDWEFQFVIPHTALMLHGGWYNMRVTPLVLKCVYV